MFKYKNYKKRWTKIKYIMINITHPLGPQK